MLTSLQSTFNKDDKAVQDELQRRKADILAHAGYLRKAGDILNSSMLRPKKQISTHWEGFAGGSKAVINGYFSDFDLAADLILKIDIEAEPSGIYFLQNECDRSLHARSYNRFQAGIGRTKGSEITKLTNLLVDFDPIRPTGISSTDNEHQLALGAADKGMDCLSELGWPEPLKADSGNGAHLNYQIDLENTAENVELISKCLKAISAKLNPQGVDIDLSVFDAPRLVKVYGTYARKGDSTAERPHRLSRIISMPETREIVSIELLQALADQAPSGDTQRVTKPDVGGDNGDRSTGVDLSSYLDHYGVDVRKVKVHGTSSFYVLENCIFDDSHTGGEAAIGQTEDGKLFYQCFHNSCQGKTWHEARKAISGDDPLNQFRSGKELGYSKEKRSAIIQSEPRRRKGKIILRRPPEFPLDVLPERYQHIIAKIANSFRVTMLIPASALIALSGACIGRSRSIRIRRGWEEHANLYIVLVGRSGSAKSPTIRTIFKRVLEVEDELSAANDLIADDFTLEALSNVLSSSPRGAMIFQDEISGLFSCLDRYNGQDGAMKARLMTAYDSGPWKVIRVNGQRNIYIPHATLSIYGSIQPEKLKEVFTKSDAASGFLPRFIFLREINPDPRGFSRVEVDEGAEVTLDKLISNLLAYEMDMGKKTLTINVTEDAQERYIEWHNALEAELWSNVKAATFYALVAKMRGQCLRVALILHCLDACACKCSELEPVSEETMMKAIRLMDYFKLHQIQAWQHLDKPNKIEELSPIQQSVGLAILELRDQISNGMIPTSLVTDRVNSKQSSEFHVSAKSIGKVAASLRLQTKHLPGENIRGICIAHEDIDRFMPLLGYQDDEDVYCDFDDE